MTDHTDQQHTPCSCGRPGCTYDHRAIEAGLQPPRHTDQQSKPTPGPEYHPPSEAAIKAAREEFRETLDTPIHDSSYDDGDVHNLAEGMQRFADQQRGELAEATRELMQAMIHGPETRVARAWKQAEATLANTRPGQGEQA